MRRKSLSFLRELVNAPSPSGFEQPAQQVVREYLTGVADEVRTDVMGNVIATLNPGGKPRLMLAGHCDEIGLMVRYITDEGYIHFSPIGGVDAHLVTGQKVHLKKVHSGPMASRISSDMAASSATANCG